MVFTYGKLIDVIKICAKKTCQEWREKDGLAEAANESKTFCCGVDFMARLKFMIESQYGFQVHRDFHVGGGETVDIYLSAIAFVEVRTLFTANLMKDIADRVLHLKARAGLKAILVTFSHFYDHEIFEFK